MKIIKTYSSEHIINDREVDTIVRNSNSNNLLLLDSGEYVRPKAIIAITDPELIPYWNGYPLSGDGRSFVRNGERIYLQPENFKEVEYRPHPKYEAIRRKLMEKMKMLSDRQRAKASEEAAREMRDSRNRRISRGA